MLNKSRGSARRSLGWDARRALQAIAIAMDKKRNAADRPKRGCAGREDLFSVALTRIALDEQVYARLQVGAGSSAFAGRGKTQERAYLLIAPHQRQELLGRLVDIGQLQH